MRHPSDTHSNKMCSSRCKENGGWPASSGRLNVESALVWEESTKEQTECRRLTKKTTGTFSFGSSVIIEGLDNQDKQCVNRNQISKFCTSGILPKPPPCVLNPCSNLSPPRVVEASSVPPALRSVTCFLSINRISLFSHRAGTGL